jgi:hypothetical protein
MEREDHSGVPGRRRQGRRHVRRARPALAAYEAKAPRVIPVIALYRRDAARAQALGDELVRIHDGLREELGTVLAGVEDFPTGRSPDAPHTPPGSARS